MKYKYNTPILIIGISFSISAVIMLVTAVILNVTFSKFKETAVPVQAVITDITTSHYRSNGKTRTSHTVYVDYQYRNEDYSNKLGYYNSGMRTGDLIDILISPDDPYKIRTSPFLATIILTPMILIFGITGGAFLIIEIRRSAAVNQLILEDRYIICTEITEIRSNTRVNGVTYNCLECKYEDITGMTYYFKSHPFHPHRSPYTDGMSVRVFVDLEKSPKLYYIPLDE